MSYLKTSLPSFLSTTEPTESNRDSVIREQKKIRENAIAQSDMLMEYKRSIVHHASHRQSSSSSSSDEGGVLSIFVSLLAEPLSKTGTKRTDADHLTIELVLHLFRNILSTEPILKSSPAASLQSAQLHNECIALFERELVLEIFMVICQEMELRENAQSNLLMMELLHHLFKSQDPTAVARCMITPRVLESVSPATGIENDGSATANNSAGTLSKSSTTHGGTSGGLLRAHMMRDRQKFRTGAPARHGNFGGTLILKRQDGKQQYVSASALMDRGGQQGSNLINSAAGPKKRKNRKTEPFIGSGRTLLAHTRAGHTHNANRGPASIRAQKTLHRFCQVFLDKCYGPVMKSLKNEFRRDSVRLEGDDDKVVFFRIIWFFFQWYRVSGIRKSKRATDDNSGDDVCGNSIGLGQLIFTMDVFTFNLVLNASTTFMTHKSHTKLAQTVALYAEMMHMLYEMYSSNDSTEQIMALGLMDRLFYGSEPVDRLPKLLSSWTPASTTREYICDLVEVTHVTLKLLEANRKSCEDIKESAEARNAIMKKKGGKTQVKTNDAVIQMKVAASDFDVQWYFLRKIVSNGVVFMYTKLLEQYATNSAHVNHRIVAFFLRLAKVKIVDAEEEEAKPQHWAPEGSEPLKNPLAPKTATLEPMLYNIQTLMVVNQILNDSSVRNDKAYATTLSWAAGVIHNFASTASDNPVLYLETLFKHPVPHRFCELSANMYVNEELRMIAERELLLEMQRQEIMNGDPSDEEDADEEDEQEFNDMEIGENITATNLKKRDASDSDEGHDNVEKSRAAINKRRKQFKKLTTAEDADDSSDDEELTFETTKTSSASADPGTPQRKSIDDDSSDEEDMADMAASLGTKSVIQKNYRDDDSDEENSDAAKIASKKSFASQKPNFDESSDEEADEESEESVEALQKALEVQKEALRKSMEDESSDGSDEESEDDSIGAKNINSLAEHTEKVASPSSDILAADQE